MYDGESMAVRRLVVYILLVAFATLPLRVFGQDGSVSTSKGCDCESVEFWLPKATNGASNLLSYEETFSNAPDNAKLLPEDLLYRSVRLLWFPKNCMLKLDKSERLKGNVGVSRQNIDDRFIEIWFKDDRLPKCIAATMKCILKSSCIGIETRTKDVGQSTQRKLLMFKTDSNEVTYFHQPYGILLSIVVFCSLIVLIALCGKVEKNSQDSVARDSAAENVKILSSEKVQSIDSKEPEQVKVDAIEIKVEGPKVATTNNNSNNASQPAGAVDLSPVAVVSESEKNPGQTSVDGAVFGKANHCKGEKDNEEETGMTERNEIARQEGSGSGKKRSDESNASVEGKKDKRFKENKKKDEKRKEVKNKDREKDMRSKRSHTAPGESVQPKPVRSKMPRLSLKSGTSNTYDEPKVSKKVKKRSKKKSDGDSPLENPSMIPFSGDRRSFVHRELPKRPSQEQDDPPDSDEDNYEVVKPQGGPPRGAARLDVPATEGSRTSDNDNDLYDRVDDTAVVKSQASATAVPNADDESDTYETVETKTSGKPKASSTNQTPDLYESVTGVYEDPGVTKQRSFSERLPGPSTSRTDSQQKSMSLGRPARGDVAPTPPPIAQLKLAKQSYQHVSVDDDIDPYTVTVKKGDRIIQETSVSMSVKPPRHHEERELSPEEKESMYTKVDKEKQKRDRMQSDGGTGEERKTNGDGEGKPNGEAEGMTNGEAEETVNSIAVAGGVPDEEHQYETMPRQKEPEKMLEKKDSFDETEDFQPYEEVDTKNS